MLKVGENLWRIDKLIKYSQYRIVVGKNSPEAEPTRTPTHALTRADTFPNFSLKSPPSRTYVVGVLWFICFLQPRERQLLRNFPEVKHSVAALHDTHSVTLCGSAQGVAPLTQQFGAFTLLPRLNTAGWDFPISQRPFGIFHAKKH